MLCLVVALACEAAPLIKHLKLKQNFDWPLPLYGREDYRLVVSGVGKLKSAIATTRLLSNLSQPKEAFCVNIGICGAHPRHRIGSLFLLNQIEDQSSKKSYFPDMLVASQIKESRLSTLETPLTQVTENLELVDMEAAGFFEAVASFLAPNRITCLKIVSDNLSGEFPSKEQVKALIEGNIEQIIEYLGRMRLQDGKKTKQPNLEALFEIIKDCKFTAAQRQVLGQRLKHRHLQDNSQRESLKNILSRPVNTKLEVDKMFRETLRILEC